MITYLENVSILRLPETLEQWGSNGSEKPFAQTLLVVHTPDDPSQQIKG